MKKHLLSLLIGLLSVTSMWAQLSFTPGETYRIRNIRAGKYLTMSDASSSAVTMADLQNSEYQFWMIRESTRTNSDGKKAVFLTNVGWFNNANKNVFIDASVVSQNTKVIARENACTNGYFILKEGTYNNYTPAYSFAVMNTSVGLNTDNNGNPPVLYNAADDGSWWVLEEAALIKPEVVTIKSNRSGKYISEADGNLLKQSSTATSADAQWIKYFIDGGIIFINNRTHNIIQPVAKNAAATTGAQIQPFEQLNEGDVYAFGTQQGKEVVYLNERNGNDVCGWTGGMGDAGNKWIINKVSEMEESEVIAILSAKSPYAKTIEDGKYYRFYNEVRDSYVFHDYVNGRLAGAGINYDDLTQLWVAEKTEAGKFRFKNIVSELYLRSSSSGMNAQALAHTNPTDYDMVHNEAVGNINAYYNFMSTATQCLHMNSSGIVVTYTPSSKDLSASEWLMCRADAPSDAALLAARSRYNEFQNSKTVFNDLLNKQNADKKLLATIFADAACTEFADEVKAMDDDEFAEAIAGLSPIYKEMCLKMRNDTWPKTKGGRDMDKFFRIADYRVYSKSNAMHSITGMSGAYSRLSNPTGISADAGDVLVIFVDQDCPANAQLCLEITDGGEKSNPRTGDQYTLNKGVNIFMANRQSDLFIFYEMTSAADSKAFHLDQFPDIKVHIEGGTCNGYYDLTRDMTDEQWADMVASGMLMHGRVFLKGSHVVGNWPSSILLQHNPTTINDIATFYNNIPKWEDEIMGLNDNYIHDIEKRYRNVFTALGTDLGSAYMYSTTYGTFYNWGTLGDILSKAVLSNPGNQWGPAHEFGHNHQPLFNMVGCTEVSNNVFSNAVIYRMGAGMSRGVALSELIPNFAERHNWMHLGIWCKTQMYWKLYQYFHLAGYDTEFYQKVFSLMRQNGLQHRNGQLVPASTDYLHFAEICCQAANADLSEFFEMYGFFDPVETDTEKNGVACQYIDDYSTYYLYSTPEMIKNSLEYCQSFEKKIYNIGFIDDRIRETPATYPGAPEGTVRRAMDGGGSNHVGSEGTVGMYLDYYPENYVHAEGYTCSRVSKALTGSISIRLAEGGQGAMGVKIYNSYGKLVYFSNDPTKSITIPKSVVTREGLTATNIVIVAADARGVDTEITYSTQKLPEDAIYPACLSNTDGVKAVKAAKRNDNQVYDLQGRKVNTVGHGLYIINGKKVIK